jgi:dihydrofolate reductase
MISIIAAMDRNRIIGQDGHIPWRLPADLAYFKQLTLGHSVIMGRKTFESIGKSLPGRENVIITRDKDYQKENCLVLHSFNETLNYCAGKNVFVIGGAQIYREFFPYADWLYITRIEESFPGDSFFPEIDSKLWKLVSKTRGERNEKNPYEYYFLIYENCNVNIK